MTTPMLSGAVMAETHVQALLSLLVALDPRMKAPDANTAALRVRAWGKLLGGVDPAYAMAYVERAYSEPRDYVLQPAEILQGWRQEAAADDAREDAQVRQQEVSRPSDPRLLDWLRRAVSAVARHAELPPWPEGARGAVLTDEQESRQRRCAWWKVCACDHLHCRDGWMDEETTVTNGLGRVYPAAKRCMFCSDALVMAEERGLARKPGGRRGTRR